MLSLPLAKLSTATNDSADGKKLNWNHETRNLILIIDTYGARDASSQLIKVVQGTQVLHLVEVERLVKDTNDLTATMQDRGIELKSEQLPITAMVRCPLLAICWRDLNQPAQRIQLRFQSNGDYDTVYNHLLCLGLRMSAAASPQGRTSATSPSRVVTIQNASTSPSTSRATPSRPYSALNAPTAIEAQIQEVAFTRPSSSYVGQASRIPQASTKFTGKLNPPEVFPRPTSATSQILLDRDQMSRNYERDSLPESSRPDTALLFDRPDTAVSLLPPRRELAFSRASNPSSSSSERPTSRMMGPPPLPARVADLRPSSSRASHAATELPALPKPTVIDITQQQPSWMQRPPRTPVPAEDQVPPPSAQLDPAVEKENRSISSAGSGNSVRLIGGRSSSSQSPNARPLSSMGTAAQNRRSKASASPITPPTDKAIHQYSTSRDASSTSPNGEVANGLAAYAMQPDEERRDALNEFMFRMLEDDGFLTLVEDMQTAYARVALGMRRE